MCVQIVDTDNIIKTTYNLQMWTEFEINFLKLHYPEYGKHWCMHGLDKTESQVRHKAADLGLRLNHKGSFCQEYQSKAAKERTGKKRPEQSLVIKALWENGKLGNYTDKQKKNISIRMKKHIAENGHPKGALGMKHTDETKEKLSKKSKLYWENVTEEEVSDRGLKAQKTRVANGTSVTPRKASWKSGWREIGGINKYYRSRWEANYARFLELLKVDKAIQSWKHEPTTFWFEAIKRGTRSYLPDFLVIESDGSEIYHEVKGWMDDRSKTKLKRMSIYHPEVKLKLIEKKQYMEIAKDYANLIVDWEYDSKGKF